MPLGEDAEKGTRMRPIMQSTFSLFIGLLLAASVLYADEIPAPAAALLERNCVGCHDGSSKKGNLDLTSLAFDLEDRATQDRWIQIHDRIMKGEMPPTPNDLPESERALMVTALRRPLATADLAKIATSGRGPMRRLNRIEFQQNLRDLLHLPHLDILDRLPHDRQSHHCDKVSSSLDMSRLQLMAYLDAVEIALSSAIVSTKDPPPMEKRRVEGKQLASKWYLAGGRESLFFTRDSKGIDLELRSPPKGQTNEPDPSVELALFRSPGWPYALWPDKVIAHTSGEYRVRFSARSVVQLKDFVLQTGTRSVPMTFRARKPTNHDIAENVRPTGGIIDILPEQSVYETVVYLQEGQTIEYGLLGLPSPQIDALGKTGYYRYPPFPEGGQPGIAFRWLEIEGPLSPETWPPASHRVLFDDLGVEVKSDNPQAEAKRLLRRFIELAAREPVPEEAIAPFEELILGELNSGETLAEALQSGYQAFLCSNLFLYLREPMTSDNHFTIANRLSHFLTNSRPDAELIMLAQDQKLRDPTTLRAQAQRLIAGDGFDHFVRHFTNSWLNLSELRRDDPNVRLYPEYRLDDYLVESMGRETRSFFATMIRDNLPAHSLIDADFAFVNNRLARHYGLHEVKGSNLQRVDLPRSSPYGGLLTQASVLKLSADGTSTSPVLRGVWIMGRLIGQPPPPPPPGIPAVEPDIRGAQTIRELIAKHTASKTCAGCHAKFDPVGLALENFDVFGAWRAHYRGLETGGRVSGIDRAGHDFSYTIASKVDASGRLADGRQFDNIHDLKALLRDDSRQLARNLLNQFTVYATGTPVRFGDRAEIESILDACANNDYLVRDLMMALINSRIFLGTNQGMVNQ